MCVPINPIETIRLINGLDLQYRESGDPRGKPLILLHGVTDSLRAWKPFTDALPRSIRAIAVTQRGHGDASKPKDDYGSAAFAGDLAALMDALGVGRAHIVGHSMSTWIAQRFARDYPDRLESMTLICGFLTLDGNPAVDELIGAIDAMGDAIDPAFVRAFQESTVATPLSPLYLDLVVAESLKVPPHVWRATFAAMASEKPDPARIACRTLLIGGARDELFSDNDRRTLAAVFSNAEEILYPDLGHAPHWEQPASVARDIAEFIG
jgi:pimeloyl-ACP methyl ester carboxylesterase